MGTTESMFNQLILHLGLRRTQVVWEIILQPLQFKTI